MDVRLQIELRGNRDEREHVQPATAETSATVDPFAQQEGSRGPSASVASSNRSARSTSCRIASLVAARKVASRASCITQGSSCPCAVERVSSARSVRLRPLLLDRRARDASTAPGQVEVDRHRLGEREPVVDDGWDRPEERMVARNAGDISQGSSTVTETSLAIEALGGVPPGPHRARARGSVDGKRHGQCPRRPATAPGQRRGRLSLEPAVATRSAGEARRALARFTGPRDREPTPVFVLQRLVETHAPLFVGG